MLPCIQIAPLDRNHVVLATVIDVDPIVVVVESDVGCTEEKKLVLLRNDRFVLLVDFLVTIFVTVPVHMSVCALFMNISKSE
jgi:hypothetical protein